MNKMQLEQTTPQVIEHSHHMEHTSQSTRQYPRHMDSNHALLQHRQSHTLIEWQEQQWDPRPLHHSTLVTTDYLLWHQYRKHPPHRRQLIIQL
jgi:hypothetical protein